jgi:hypothetical protein
MDELAAVGPAQFTARSYRLGHVTHCVFFKLASGLDDEAKREIVSRFHALAGSLRDDGQTYIVSIEGGAQVSGEQADPIGFDLGFVVTFQSLGDRNYYVGSPIVTHSAYQDPAHAAFKDFVGPLVAERGVLVFDIYSPAAKRLPG